MRFEYSKSGDGTWSWRLKSAIDEIVAHGGTYPSRDTCLAAIRLVKLAAAAGCRDVTAAGPAAGGIAPLPQPA